MRDGNAPEMARWLAEDTHRLVEWETDLSSQTGASQAGILLGSNEDIPAFRWVEKETATLMVCSNPDDCAEIERRRSNGDGLLANGGASRGNLLSGDADHVLLTVSRISAEKKANPGYRAFFANGFNVTRVLVLFFWEVVPGVDGRAPRRPSATCGRAATGAASTRSCARRSASSSATSPCMRVLSDMLTGRPAVYATFASYDEVAHHSGLERADTLEALRKLDQQFGRIDACAPLRAAPVRDRRSLRPRPDAGRNVQAAQRLRPRRPDPRSIDATVQGIAGEDENQAIVGNGGGRGDGQRARLRRQARHEGRCERRGGRRARLRATSGWSI